MDTLCLKHLHDNTRQLKIVRCFLTQNAQRITIVRAIRWIKRWSQSSNFAVLLYALSSIRSPSPWLVELGHYNLRIDCRPAYDQQNIYQQLVSSSKVVLPL